MGCFDVSFCRALLLDVVHHVCPAACGRHTNAPCPHIPHAHATSLSGPFTHVLFTAARVSSPLQDDRKSPCPDHLSQSWQGGNGGFTHQTIFLDLTTPPTRRSKSQRGLGLFGPLLGYSPNRRGKIRQANTKKAPQTQKIQKKKSEKTRSHTRRARRQKATQKTPSTSTNPTHPTKNQTQRASSVSFRDPQHEPSRHLPTP